MFNAQKFWLLVAAGAIMGVLLVAGGRAAEKADAGKAGTGDALFEQKNYLEAAEAYLAAVSADARPADWYRQSERIIVCHLRLGQFDDALAAAELHVQRCKDTPLEARASRTAGNLYLMVPHWGTRAGGKFLRNQWTQGIQLQSHQHDKKLALQHLQHARDLYAKYDGNAEALNALPEAERKTWREERIGCLFDLSSACAKFGIYENEAHFWYGFWGERDDAMADTAGEQDFDEYSSMWQRQRSRPIGLRLDAAGEPIFPTRPAEWSATLGDDQKLLYLLHEIRELDPTDTRRFAALSRYRQAMLARARFGMDRMSMYAGNYHDGTGQPLQAELEAINPWELKDNEAIVLTGGRFRRVTLPDEWNVLGLLGSVAGDHKQSGIADQALYGMGVYLQSRQQYPAAIKTYDVVIKAFPKGLWVEHARTQIARIQLAQVQINAQGIQPPGNNGNAATVDVSYRNTSKVWFVARKFDHVGYMAALRALDVHPDKGFPEFWSIGQWSSLITNGWGRAQREDNRAQKLAIEHLGEVVAEWSADVKPGEGHRYANATVNTPLKDRGAYLVYAYLKQPPADHKDKTGLDAMALGDNRGVVVLNDLAIVEKNVEKGTLYFICDAMTGAPAAEASVSVLEVWNTWDSKKKKSVHHKALYDLTTDADGLAVLPRPDRNWGQMHVLVKQGERAAWTGMSYRSHYYPSAMRAGLFAYCITDRPVYRPNQAVRFKLWVTQMTNGNFEPLPTGHASLTIYDPRGNKVHDHDGQLDAYGALDGSFTLGDEPTLGEYRIDIHAASVVGGNNFRVEEYKKPEFEVTVEPDTDQARLGEKVNAVIKAKYYFGSPVTNATVDYKVFREEYTHTWYPAGEWDWLYGQGYGLPWYEHPWFGFWGSMRSCWAPPHWWWGYYGGSRANPVRELVQQGSATLDADGKLNVTIDTAPAKRDHPDRDHRYVIQADVRDESRRVISGEGAVVVTRQAYYAFVQPGRGYYRPGEEMLVEIRCLTPGNKPMTVDGMVTVSEVVFGGPDNAHMKETVIEEWKASTNSDGRLAIRLRHERSGQLKIRFAAPDQWGGTVEGFGLIWVCGRDFDGQFHRFNDLELITDKRTYKPGEIAHVMINTKVAGSHVLFSDNVDNSHLLSWKLIHIPGRHTIVSVPVTREHHPNFFIEATTVNAARVHQQSAQVCVPPEEGIVKISVATDKGEYLPGQKANVTVTARTLDGKPVEAQLTLSAFDKSVLYIQPEYTPQIAGFFHGRTRSHSMQMTSNLYERFAAVGHVQRPFQQLYPVPPDWQGTWGPQVDDWRVVEGSEFEVYSSTVGREMSRKSAFRGVGGAMPAAAPMAMAKSVATESAGLAMAGVAMDAADGNAGGGAAGASGGTTFAEATVRQQFADTALWLTTITTDADGHATSSFDMPENLTTWKLNAWAMTKAARVGQAETFAVTTKNLLVRLQSPRFFTERDEVVISANVHNYLASAKTARVTLDVPAELLKFIGDAKQTVDVSVPAGGEVRVDWRVKVLREGSADLLVKALTDEESDAMKLTIPVLVHGITKQVATTGSIRPADENNSVTVELTVPDERRPELTRLEVRFAPSLVGAMIDALPYTLDYPYGCTEQTMSRFLPAVLTLKTLRNMGINLEDIKNIKGRLDEVRRIEKGENRRIYSSYADSPVFDEKVLADIIDKSLRRIAAMQNADGGWGWWSNDQSNGYLTSYVLYALVSAQQADQAIDPDMIQRGMQSLQTWAIGEMRLKSWDVHAQWAYCAYVLSMGDQRAVIEPLKDDNRPGDLIERLWQGRDKLNLYGKALLALTLSNLGDDARAKTTLQNIMQYKQENEATQVAWFRTPEHGWWYWWNNDIETGAWILRAITKIDPQSDVAPKLVKWLLNNRRNGYYWRSTRDTTLCVHAMSDFVIASGEADADYTLTLNLDDGQVVKQVKINRDNFFTFDNQFVIEGAAIAGGKHKLTITREGKGAVYFNTYLRYFTMEEPITAVGHELNVERTYFLLKQIPYEVTVQGSKGQEVQEQRLRYERVALNSGDEVQSGDIVQVELKVTSDNHYTFLAFEDAKPAGFEAVDIRSGGKGQEGFATYMELRDEKVVFFAGELAQGEHLLRYRLRAEVPGVFHALPTLLHAMYVPELRANSDEQVIGIVDK